MPASFNSRRLHNQREMERRLTADHRGLARAAARVVQRFATVRDAAGQPIVPNTRAARTAIRTAIWAEVIKPYYIGAGTDALIEAAPQSPFARLLVEGITQATRIQAERQAALVRRLVKDPVVVQWLIGPRSPLAVQELTVPVGAPPSSAAAQMAGLRGADGRIDMDRARAALVQPRGMYEPFHAWVDPNGYRLSDRIWRAGIDVRARIDGLMDYHIGRGTGATEIANLLEPFLAPGARESRTRTPYGTNGSYAARRLARTEITAAAGRATVNAAAANPFVQSVQWALSARHPKFDICDLHARGGPNGDGIYPLGQVPAYPPHPQCLCNLRPVPSGNSADLVASLRQDIQAARSNLLAGVGGEQARALQGILNPDYLTRAILTGNLDSAVQAAVTQARALPVGAALVPVAVVSPVPAAVAVGPTPTGAPVSGALQLPTRGKYAARYQETLDAIDAVHGDGALPELPVMTKSDMDALGQYRFYARSGKPVEIIINGKGHHHQMTLAHEIGHFLDYQAMSGTPGRAATDQRGLMDSWRKAVDGSAAVQRLRDKRRDPMKYAAEVTVAGSRFTARPDSTFVTYLLDPKEIWARSYAQYIATRSQNPAMLQQVMGERIDPIYGDRQWDDDDFAPIAAAIDALFRGLGWRQ